MKQTYKYRLCVMAVHEILKKRFNNLSSAELMTLCMDIVDAVDRELEKEE